MSTNILIISIVGMLLAYRLISMAIKRRSGGGCEPPSEESATPESELLREVYQGLVRMEKRIEALETLLADCEESHEKAASEKRL